MASNNRYYKYYQSTVLDLVSTKCSVASFSSSYKLMLQKKFNYNFSVFKSSNGIFVYGAAFTFFGGKPYKVISSKSIRSKRRFATGVSLFNSEVSFLNTRKTFFKGIERFSVLALPSRGAYGFLDFFPKSDTPTHVSVFCKGVNVNPEMVGLSWRMRSICTYSVWFKIKSENLGVSWTFLRCFQIPALSVPFDLFMQEDAFY